MITDYCHECRTYADVRFRVLAPAMAARCEETGETPKEIADRYMLGVHARHLAGLSILPTPAPAHIGSPRADGNPRSAGVGRGT